jgi:hypothetical protein
VSQLLLAHRELDDVIVEMLHQNDYLTFYDHDAQANPFRYHPSLFATRLAESVDPEDFISLNKSWARSTASYRIR